ncbi:methylated-DNA--protein-cysteine methyltransferase [Caerostris extrusa]|uniref:Methylated-DNA--protein-cysteine methyltransferase n=1 Tax=Caerostris extrusa TaxID=172846 RepID=A0AAV4U3F3_CAEEX|nr:methylated-DNA--protein-cysteine methyltransferase [Caerostris extrusa]
MNSCSVSVFCVKVPIGNLQISYCLKGIHSIEILQKVTDTSPTCESALEKDFSNKVLMECIQWLKFYFDGTFEQTDKFLPPVCPSVYFSKGDFTVRVWKTLAKCSPRGKTVSYGALASLCGSAGASRAVGSAMAANPLPLLVPCHRVVRANGTVGPYSGGGQSVKQWLLVHEGALGR